MKISTKRTYYPLPKSLIPLTQSLLQLSFLILYTEISPVQLLFPLPAPCNAQLGYASNMGLEPLGVFLGMVAKVAGTPALKRGIARKNLSGVISKPVNTVFSGLKKNIVVQIGRLMIRVSPKSVY